ncbi:MAG: hypothetical protein Q4D14_02895 [Bacteroidales bacterium]|nr:hypothetical protein [Bacteroidales bacterium]
MKENDYDFEQDSHPSFFRTFMRNLIITCCVAMLLFIFYAMIDGIIYLASEHPEENNGLTAHIVRNVEGTVNRNVQKINELIDDTSEEDATDPKIAMLNNIKAEIIETEQARLPLTIQETFHARNIVIDSIRIIGKKEPYEALLFTTWTLKSSGKKKGVVVKISSISSGIADGKLTWYTHWGSADTDLFHQ